MVRALDRFYARHPRIAMTLAVLVVFVCLYISHEMDESNSNAPRVQMMAARHT